MKYAILGGSFNPVHLGHLFLADAVLGSLGYDRIILIPAFQSPFKLGAETASPQDRMDMLASSISADSRLTLDDCEIRRQGVSYTIDTLAEIQEKYRPEGKPGLILGDDLAETFHKWHNAPAIAEKADIIIARRLFGPESRDGFNFPYPYRGMNNEIINISSQLVREKILKGENWRYLVPGGARYIIEDRGLYGCNIQAEESSSEQKGDLSGGKGSGEIKLETIAFLENLVRRQVNPSRFIHSRNTALLARDLCLRYHLDPLAGYLAGITHDMCKSVNADIEEMIRLAQSDGKGMTRLETERPALLHGRAAAVILQSRYSITNREILDAIAFHTTGDVKMGPLAKVIYIADKIEVSRPGVDPVLREMAEKAGLDELFAAVLDKSVEILHSRNLYIADETQKLLSAMGRKTTNRKFRDKS